MDNNRYWNVYAYGTGNSVSIDTTTGSAVLTKTGPGSVSLAYAFSTPTDLSGNTTLNILGSGSGSVSYEIGLWDGDGDAFGKWIPLAGSFGDFLCFAARRRGPCSGRATGTFPLPLASFRTAAADVPISNPLRAAACDPEAAYHQRFPGLGHGVKYGLHADDWQ